MLIYSVEKNKETVSIFESTINLLIFLYLHKDEFGFDDRGEDLYTMLRSGDSVTKLNRYVQNVEIKQWNTGEDVYTQDDDKHGKHVRDIAETLPKASWEAQMMDGSRFTVIAPIKPLAVEKAHAEHILDMGTYAGVKEIRRL